MRPTNFQGNVHIINFPPDAEAEDLAALFDEFGLVLGAQIKKIASTGSSSLRLGIVALAPDAAADRAIAALQGHSMRGLKLKLRRAKVQVKAKPKPGERRVERPTFPSAHVEPPRKVIVEYRGRRSRAIEQL